MLLPPVPLSAAPHPAAQHQATLVTSPQQPHQHQKQRPPENPLVLRSLVLFALRLYAPDGIAASTDATATTAPSGSSGGSNGSNNSSSSSSSVPLHPSLAGALTSARSVVAAGVVDASDLVRPWYTVPDCGGITVPLALPLHRIVVELRMAGTDIATPSSLQQAWGVEAAAAAGSAGGHIGAVRATAASTAAAALLGGGRKGWLSSLLLSAPASLLQLRGRQQRQQQHLVEGGQPDGGGAHSSSRSWGAGEGGSENLNGAASGSVNAGRGVLSTLPTTHFLWRQAVLRDAGWTVVVIPGDEFRWGAAGGNGGGSGQSESAAPVSLLSTPAEMLRVLQRYLPVCVAFPAR